MPRLATRADSSRLETASRRCRGRRRSAGWQRQADFIHAVRQDGAAARRRRTSAAWARCHRAFRLEGADSPAAGERDQMLQQQRAETRRACHRRRHGDLRRPGAAVGQAVAGAADHLALQHRQQRGAVRPGLAAYPARFLLGRELARRRSAGTGFAETSWRACSAPHRNRQAARAGSQSWSRRSAARRHSSRPVHARRSPVLPSADDAKPYPHYRIGRLT